MYQYYHAFRYVVIKTEFYNISKVINGMCPFPNKSYYVFM